jgi:hypothetical protein
MKRYGLGTVIADRKLSLTDGTIVTVQIGMPQRSTEEFYFCPYKIVGLGDGKTRRAGGVDAVQALQLALQKVGIDLYVLKDARKTALSWEGGAEGDLGFPLPENISEILKR